MRRGDDPVDRTIYPVDEWALVEVRPCTDPARYGHGETLFSVGNGYLGLRGNVDEGDAGYLHGTYANGFHETWPIRHAEDQYGLARVGQTIVNLPDPKTLRLAVDGEEFTLASSGLLSYERRLDFRTGILGREVVWRTAAGRHVRVVSRRLVSFTDRNLALLETEVTVLDADAELLLTSVLANRLALGADDMSDADELDPRKADRLHPRTLESEHFVGGEHRIVQGLRTRNSRMTAALAIDHRLLGAEARIERELDPLQSAYRYRVAARAGEPVTLTRLVAVHTSDLTDGPDGDPAELAARCEQTLDAALARGTAGIVGDQADWLGAFWARSDVEVDDEPEVQQAIRWNLFELAQAAGRADGEGIPAKGVSSSGYDGHTFWDSEIYVLPFFTYTTPSITEAALEFRFSILDRARERAREMSLRGALFPWRTINGLEASAYYPAGTAQYHIDADVARAVEHYVAATGDEEFFVRAGAEILIETARMWADLGFWRTDPPGPAGTGEPRFHLHGVTGPDEYTTVVDDNLFTNLSARANLRAAVAAVHRLRAHPAASRELATRLGLKRREIAEWERIAEGMHVAFDENLGVHPQHDDFLQREIWDPKEIPREKRPLLLHFHPLVINRHQILKQADVVLAILLHGPAFTPEQKLADFDYYDPITTGDSSLSAVAQSVVAAEVGHQELSLKHFRHGVFVDLADLHGNTKDGVHVASTGGVWLNVVAGFGGFRDDDGVLSLDPHMPPGWQHLRYRLTAHGTRVLVDQTRDLLTLTAETGAGLEIVVRGVPLRVVPGAPVAYDLDRPRVKEPMPQRRRRPVRLPAEN
jgi:alpha,alpha-trehalose phosphorylase